MHIILTGATGTVGSPTLRACLASPNVTRLTILSRREFPLPEGLDHQKAQIIVHEDYTNYPPSLIDTLKGAHGCIWAQGISQTQVSKPEYIRITYDYPLAAAKAFSTLSDKFNFVYVSGEGADPTEKTYTLFGKTKGRAEASLRALPSTPAHSALRIFNVRSGYVDRTPEQRASLTFGKSMLANTLGPIFRTIVPSQVSPAGVLAGVLVNLATGDGEPLKEGVGVEDEGRLLRSVGIRRLGGL